MRATYLRRRRKEEEEEREEERKREERKKTGRRTFLCDLPRLHLPALPVSLYMLLFCIFNPCLWPFSREGEGGGGGGRHSW